MIVRNGTDRARQLRRDQTEAEAKLWAALRGRQLDGFKFRRQFPGARYFADFACIEAKLVIELDGSQHASQLEYDQARSAVLQRAGFEVIRFWNEDVLSSLDAVLEAIRAKLHAGSI